MLTPVRSIAVDTVAFADPIPTAREASPHVPCARRAGWTRARHDAELLGAARPAEAHRAAIPRQSDEQGIALDLVGGGGSKLSRE